MYEKIVKWAHTKWKGLLTFFSVAAAGLFFYMRSKDQKKILENANESHKKENIVNEKSKKDLIDGIEKIRKSENDQTDAALKNHEKNKKDLKEKKEEFIEEVKNDPDLAENIADKLGVKFVKSSNE